MGCNQSKKEEEGKQEEQSAAAPAEGGEAGPRLIVVFGGSGQQGGSVAKALLGDSDYKVRVITRNPESDKAKELAEKGAELLKADLDDSESLAKALDGAYGAFLVTNFFDPSVQDKEKEIKQGKALVDAAKEAKIEHLVFSGLESVKEAIDKECAHFDGKAEIEKYIQEKEIPFTIVRYSFYYENLLTLMKPKKNEEGEYALDIPMGDSPLSMVCVEETGECVHQIFVQGEEYKGKTIGLASQQLKVEEYAAIITKAVDDKKVVAGKVTTEDLAKSEFPFAADLAVMFDYYQSGKCERDIETTRKLNPDISAFETWVDNQKEALTAVMD